MVTRLDLLLSILATCCNLPVLSFEPRSARLAPWKAAESRHRMGRRPENHNHVVLIEEELNRRRFFGQVAGAFATVAAISIPSQEAHARGLAQFPCTAPLFNEYHLMRAGTTFLEEQDIWSTNPLFLTNREAALSERGIQQVQAASRQLASLGINPSVVKYSLAAAAMDSANIVKEELRVGQNRLVPEFFFMDPRAVGKFDMMSIQHTQPAVVAFDVNEAGPEGRGGRPPPNEDGTPHETLQDQSIRLRQLISGTETQFSGDTILLIFPDSTGPALLSCMIAGIPYNRVHELEFEPGELRLDVTLDSTLALLKQKEVTNMDSYQATLTKGQEELKRLQSLNMDEVVSLKDQRMEQERIEMDQQYEQKQKEARRREEAEKQTRLERLRILDTERRRQRGTIVENEDAVPPLVIAGALGALVVGAFNGGQKEDEERNATEVYSASSDRSNPSNDTLATLLGPNTQPGGTQTNGPPLQMKAVSYDESIEQTTHDPTSSPDPKSLFDNLPPAGNAMKDYLYQDDGGEAWLQVMGQLIEEDDEEDEEPTAGGGLLDDKEQQAKSVNGDSADISADDIKGDSQ